MRWTGRGALVPTVTAMKQSGCIAFMLVAVAGCRGLHYPAVERPAEVPETLRIAVFPADGRPLGDATWNDATGRMLDSLVRRKLGAHPRLQLTQVPRPLDSKGCVAAQAVGADYELDLTAHVSVGAEYSCDLKLDLRYRGRGFYCAAGDEIIGYLGGGHVTADLIPCRDGLEKVSLVDVNVHHPRPIPSLPQVQAMVRRELVAELAPPITVPAPVPAAVPLIDQGRTAALGPGRWVLVPGQVVAVYDGTKNAGFARVASVEGPRAHLDPLREPVTIPAGAVVGPGEEPSLVELVPTLTTRGVHVGDKKHWAVGVGLRFSQQFAGTGLSWGLSVDGLRDGAGDLSAAALAASVGYVLRLSTSLDVFGALALGVTTASWLRSDDAEVLASTGEVGLQAGAHWRIAGRAYLLPELGWRLSSTGSWRSDVPDGTAAPPSPPALNTGGPFLRLGVGYDL